VGATGHKTECIPASSVSGAVASAAKDFKVPAHEVLESDFFAAFAEGQVILNQALYACCVVWCGVVW
jgi:hypothetical protein